MKTLSKHWKKYTITLPRFSRLIIGLIMALLLALTACQSQPGITETQLKLAGSTTLQRSAEGAAEFFMAQHPGITITVRGGGSTIGVEGTASGALQIGMASRPFKSSELETWPDLKATVVGRDGVAVVVNHFLYDNGVTELTLEEVAAIWRGEITNWQQVGGPDLAIVAYDKEFGRGTRDVFASLVLGDVDAAAPGTVGQLGANEDILTAVSQEDGAISIVSTGWQTEEVIGVAIVGPDGQSVAPTKENVANGLYIISRDLSLITLGEPDGLAKQFIDFFLSPEGQQFIEQAGYSPVVQ